MSDQLIVLRLVAKRNAPPRYLFGSNNDACPSGAPEDAAGALETADTVTAGLGSGCCSR